MPSVENMMELKANLMGSPRSTPRKLPRRDRLRWRARHALLPKAPTMATVRKSALDAVKRFRARELAGLIKPTPLPLPEQPSAETTASALHNPFVPHKNPATGRWAPPKYSLRHQAKLVKQAKVSGTLHLLPPGLKYDAAAPKRPEDDAAYMAKLRARQERVAARTGGSDIFAILDAQEKKVEEVVVAEESGEVLQTDAVADIVSSVAAKATSLRARHRAAKVTSQPEVQEPIEPREWDSSVEWVGTPRRRYIPGADIGVRLYAGKRLMFKGHRWEREKPERERRTQMLLRDMPQRIDRFRTVRILLGKNTGQPAHINNIVACQVKTSATQASQGQGEGAETSFLITAFVACVPIILMMFCGWTSRLRFVPQRMI